MVATIAPANDTPSVPTERGYWRVKRGAEYCGLSESEMYRAIYAGELKALRYRSRTWLLTKEDIDAWIAANSAPNVA